MQLKLILEQDGNTFQAGQDVRGWTREQVLDYVGKSYDLFKSVDKSGKRLVLTGLMTKGDKISYIKAIRDGTGNNDLKRAKELMEQALTRNGVVEVPSEHFDGVLKQCEKLGIAAVLMTTDEVACLEVHES